MRNLTMFLTAAIISSTALAQEPCTKLVGTTVSPSSFDAVWAKFGGFSPRGEYETSAQFEARANAVFPPEARPLVISKQPESRVFFEYDANAQTLRVSSLAFDMTGFAPWRAFLSARAASVQATPGKNIDVVLSQVDKVTGSYLATNPFGVRVKVTKVHRITKAIYDRDGISFSEKLFPDIDRGNFIAELPMSPAEARSAKTTLSLAFVVRPKQPFFVSGEHPLEDATLEHPKNVREEFSILIADIQCALVLNPQNKVLAAVLTN